MMTSQVPSPDHPLKMNLRQSFSTSPQFATPPTTTPRSNSDGFSLQRTIGTGQVPSNTVEAPPAIVSTRLRSRSFGEGSTIATTINAPGTLAKVSPQSSALAFCPSQYNLYACINCVTGTHTIPSDGSTSRLGPILLELRRLEITNELESRHRGQVFASQSVCVSRGKATLGNSVASTCLSFRPYPEVDPLVLQPCATGLTTGGLCVHSFTQEANDDILSSRDYFATRHQRPASAVAWSPKESRHVAIGLVGIGGPTTGPGGVRRGNTRPGGSGDKDFCCLLWDVESQQSSKGATVAPLSKYSHSAGVSSMAWCWEGQTLAVGCQVQFMQLYDLRVSGNTCAPPLSILAHKASVDGIEVDPWRPDVVATFSRGHGESVKVWDLRNSNAPISEIKLNAGNDDGFDSAPHASAVRWSSNQTGILSVVISNVVQHYDTMASGSRPVLTESSMSSSPILDIAVNPLSYKNRKSRSVSLDELAMDLYSNRMLTVVKDMTVQDIAKHTKAPLVISHRDGRLIHALGRSIWTGMTAEGLEVDNSTSDDISMVMMRRARCLQESRYTLHAAANIQMLANENRRSVPDGARRESLIQAWNWVARVETLCGYDTEMVHTNWPAKGLVDAGVWHFLDFDNLEKVKDEIIVVSKSIHYNTYGSIERRSALLTCGWSDDVSVSEFMAECERAGEYERAAALAVWYDDLAAAVDVLQRGAIKMLDNSSSNGSHIENLEYSQSMQLVAMCIAGYPGVTGKASQIWLTACQSLLERQDFSHIKANQHGAGYLQATCNFLMNIGSESGLECILVDSTLRLSDRVAFACRFLERAELKKYLLKAINESQIQGQLEGLIITGVDKKGLQIIQAFLDQCSDIQTVALLTSRVVLPDGWTTEKELCLEWLDSYRALLNTWQMWQSRAMFDVDRAELLRRTCNGSRVVMKGHPMKKLINPIMKQSNPDSLEPLQPAQLDVRCNFCSMSLSGVRRQESSANQWLSKQKTVLSCCPSCRKPLPRCAICLLPLGCLNPYMDLKNQASRSTRGMDSLEALANLPFAEWFTWCMRCKHGGHAHHVVGWFANHESCPVSGCNCRCQFDGIKKLVKPSANSFF